MKTLVADANGMANVVPARGGGVRDWQRWAPYAAVAWSLIYAALGVYWAVSGRGFPYTPNTVSDGMGPLVGRFGPGVAWIVVILAGIPAAAMGVAMLRGVRSRALRPLFITAGALLAGVLLLLMTGLNSAGHCSVTSPMPVVSLFTGAEFSQVYLEGWTQWATIHQLLCLIGGFLWLAATVSYARRSGDACLYCGRRDGPEGWNEPEPCRTLGPDRRVCGDGGASLLRPHPLRLGAGVPAGDERGVPASAVKRVGCGSRDSSWRPSAWWGPLLMLGLVQRWGEVFPRWMIGLAGRRVPIALAVVPASLVSVLLIVGGIGIWSGLAQMVANLVAGGAEGTEIIGEIIFQVGPTLLFPVWGVALAVATLGYYYRRRGPCSVCGRGASGEIE